MASRNAYIFNTETEAQAAIAAIDAHYADQLDGVRTVNWTVYHEWGDVWVIFADVSLVDVLGDAVMEVIWTLEQEMN